MGTTCITSSALQDLAGDALICPICYSNKTKKAFSLQFRATSGPISTDIYVCGNCRVYWRVFTDTPPLDAHFEITSYTDIQYEPAYKTERTGFFKQIIDIAKERASLFSDETSKPTLMDFGCSYGHLMDVASTDGFHCIGVELADHLRQRLASQYEMHKNTDSIPDNSANIITCIDSLYYCEDVYLQMEQFHRILKKDGLLLLRICNRNYFIKLLQVFGRTITPKLFGDQLFALNHKSIKIITGAVGFKIEGIVYKEIKPKKQGILLQVGYGVLPFICRLTGLKLTPGLLYILRKK